MTTKSKYLKIVSSFFLINTNILNCLTSLLQIYKKRSNTCLLVLWLPEPI